MKISLKFEDLPRAIRQMAVSSLGLRNYRARYGDEYKQQARFISESSDYENDRIEGWQLDRLQTLLGSAVVGTEHYASMRDVWSAISQIKDLRTALDMIPPLEKSELRANTPRFSNRNVPFWQKTSTSGSTGQPMTVEHDKLSIQRRFAFFHAHSQMAGVSPFDPSIRLSGRVLCRVGHAHKKPWLANASERQIFLSSYHLDERHAPAIGWLFNRFKPVLLDGYPSAILETLSLMSRHDVDLSSIKAIISTAETLAPETREAIQAIAKAPVLDYYSASEGLPYIQQCREGTYHVRWQSGIFEVDTGDAIRSDGDGELVCTSFVQDRTPLIRYRTGDLVHGLRADPHLCACGMRTPTVAGVLGRVEDRVYTPDGRALGMFTYRTLKYIDGLHEAQVVQEDYDVFVVKAVVKDLPAALVESKVKESFERALGYNIKLHFQAFGTLPKGPNGKVRLVTSKVGRAS